MSVGSSLCNVPSLQFVFGLVCKLGRLKRKFILPGKVKACPEEFSFKDANKRVWMVSNYAIDFQLIY